MLASTSRYRASLLERLGLQFTQVAPACDEEALKGVAREPVALAEHLALAKAESLASRFSGSAIIGSDQLVTLDGEIFGKPGSVPRAVDQLLRLAGRRHTLVTALAVWFDGKTQTHVDLTALTMRPLTRAAAERYVAADSPLDCAGAYKLEARGIALFSRVESADQTAITGLPLIALTEQLLSLGFVLP